MAVKLRTKVWWKHRYVCDLISQQCGEYHNLRWGLGPYPPIHGSMKGQVGNSLLNRDAWWWK